MVEFMAKRPAVVAAAPKRSCRRSLAKTIGSPRLPAKFDTDLRTWLGHGVVIGFGDGINDVVIDALIALERRAVHLLIRIGRLGLDRLASAATSVGASTGAEAFFAALAEG